MNWYHSLGAIANSNSFMWTGKQQPPGQKETSTSIVVCFMLLWGCFVCPFIWFASLSGPFVFLWGCFVSLWGKFCYFVSQRSNSHWPWLIWNPVQLRSAAAQLLSHMCPYCSAHTLKHTPTISQCQCHHALMLALSPTWEELGIHLNNRWPFETLRHWSPSPTSSEM